MTPERPVRQDDVQSEARLLALHTIFHLASVLAHDLKLSVATIGNWTELLEKNASGNQEVHDACDAIRDAARAAVERLNWFQMAVSPPRSEMRIVAMRTLLSQFTSGIEEVALSITVPHDDVLIEADPGQIQFVLEILLSNSRRAIEDRQCPGIIEITALAESHEVFLRWRDNGCGMSKSTRERCFEPFFTTTNSGIGMGLFTARRIVEEHGGRIEVESSDGEGVCFTIALRRHIRSEVQ